MKGSDVVGDVPSGTKLQVTKVINGWLGAVIDVNGQKLNGWTWHRTQPRIINSVSQLTQLEVKSRRRSLVAFPINRRSQRLQYSQLGERANRELAFLRKIAYIRVG